MFKDDLLAGQHILITGGGTGLGKSMGRRCLELGARLSICRRAGRCWRPPPPSIGPRPAGPSTPSPATSATRMP